MSTQMGNLISWKKVLLVAIVTLALILSGCGRSEESTIPTEEESTIPTEEESTIPTETETLIDEIVQNLIQDASTEQEAILDEEVEAAVLDAEDVLPRDIGELADDR